MFRLATLNVSKIENVIQNLTSGKLLLHFIIIYIHYLLVTKIIAGLL